jgi:adenylate cyclase
LPTVHFDGREISLRGQRKAQALLSYLAMSGKSAEDRDRIGELLWGDTDDHERKRGSLRKLAHDLKEALAASGADTNILQSARSTLGLAEGGFSVDALRLAAAVETGLVPTPLLERTRIDGDILAGLEDVEPNFRTWLLGWRRGYRTRLLRALERTLRRGPGGTDPDLPAHAATALLNLEPAHEEACRLLMRSCAEAGDTVGALRVYDALWRALEDEHDVEPSASTQALIAQIKTGYPGFSSPRATSTARPPPEAKGSGKQPQQVAPGDGEPVRKIVAAKAGCRPCPANAPSLVVLPFTHLSCDSEQEYFADGIVDDITTALSRITWLFVISRNSAFTYKGKAVDVPEISAELGVRYLLNGSIRKSGSRVRITAQLVDAESGGQIWASRFDGDLSEMFELQDRVAEEVSGSIEPSLSLAEIKRSRVQPTENLAAYDLYLRALPHHYAQTREDSDAALDLLRRAATLDPGFSLAKAFAAYTVMIREIQGWLLDGEREEGARLAHEALQDGRDDPTALRFAGQAIAWLARDRARGLAAVERSLALNPNSAQAHGAAAWTMLYLGRPDPATTHFKRAMRLSPLDPQISYFLSGLGYAYVMARRFEDAVEVSTRAVAEMPERATGYRSLAAALHALGRAEDVREVGQRYRAATPAGARVFASRIAAEFADERFVEAMVAGLRAAGLPE